MTVVASMTGFARAEGSTASSAWVWELRSVNGRGLDLRFRLPPGLEAMEPALRQAAMKVLNDKRLNGFELEAAGHFTTPDHFVLDPNHARTVLAHNHGKTKMITYWCDVCSIRSYEPGPCWCCQAETVLQLRDPDEP